MSNKFAQKQNELATHLSEWREYIIKLFKPYIENKWFEVGEIKISGKPSLRLEENHYQPLHYFSVTISDGPYELTHNCDHFSTPPTEIAFISNGIVLYLGNIFALDETGIASDFYVKNRSMCTKLDYENFEDALQILKMLLEYYATVK